MTIKRQFIAGAACPRCGEVDRVQRCTEGDRIWMECVACGMKKFPEDPPEPDKANLFRGPPQS